MNGELVAPPSGYRRLHPDDSHFYSEDGSLAFPDERALDDDQLRREHAWLGVYLIRSARSNPPESLDNRRLATRFLGYVEAEIRRRQVAS